MDTLEELLEKTSRTFALSIPLLPEPTRREVTVAYLLFRVADTFEDAARWPPRTRVEALEEFAALLREPSDSRAGMLASRWLAKGPTEHAGYLALLARLPEVLAQFRALRGETIGPIREHLLASARGMAAFVARSGDRGELELTGLDDLRAYCYVVAGVVGEMLTELFLLRRDSLVPVAPQLRARARLFGEGLQLVNILKDSASDAAEGRRYLPPALDLAKVFGLARQDLDDASEYIALLARGGAPRGILGFTALPVDLARATLDRVEARGPGARLTRTEVLESARRIEAALDRGEPPRPGNPHGPHPGAGGGIRGAARRVQRNLIYFASRARRNGRRRRAKCSCSTLSRRPCRVLLSQERPVTLARSGRPAGR